MRALILRLEAPLMAFGDVMVDAIGRTARYPAASMLTGLLANALGWDQGAFDRHDRLQQRLRFAARRDRDGRILEDYQTVDLGQPFMTGPGWTTTGSPQKREGGPAAKGTHIRRREYLEDACVTVALALDPPAEDPDLDALATALRAPRRPLFIGRKPCLPSAPLLLGAAEGAGLLDILARVPPAEGLRPAGAGAGAMFAIWPPEEEGGRNPRPVIVHDRRDWRNQIHVGERLMLEGEVEITLPEEGR